MKILTYLTDNLYYHQKKLEGFAIFLLCLIIAFQFENFKLTWLWNDKIHIAIVLVLIILLTSLIWVRIERKRTNELIEQIKTETLSNKPQLENPTTELSVRQRQVFDLIVSGKSNKEIMDELCIELSTLKTHINNIYRILNIKSRKEMNKYKNSKN